MTMMILTVAVRCKVHTKWRQRWWQFWSTSLVNPAGRVLGSCFTCLLSSYSRSVWLNLLFTLLVCAMISISTAWKPVCQAPLLVIKTPTATACWLKCCSIKCIICSLCWTQKHDYLSVPRSTTTSDTFPIPQHVQFMLCLLMFKALRGLAPSYLADLSTSRIGWQQTRHYQQPCHRLICHQVWILLICCSGSEGLEPAAGTHRCDQVDQLFHNCSGHISVHWDQTRHAVNSKMLCCFRNCWCCYYYWEVYHSATFYDQNLKNFILFDASLRPLHLFFHRIHILYDCKLHVAQNIEII